MTCPHHAYPDVSWSDLRTEILREIATRKVNLFALVTKGRITREEADYEQDVMNAILEDAERFRKALAPVDQGKPMINPLRVERAEGSSQHDYTWHQRRAALTRELEYRQRLYPEMIRKGRLTQDQANLYTRRLTAMRGLYEYGYDYAPSFPDDRAPSGTWSEWLAILTDIDARDGTTLAGPRPS
ncbi:hypothetical protein HT136_01270 [Novosphingobium profundi]|uniref:hypothetical protein n=1 Tax=Novosphingobium profundi TaxID=1774954 RepID=UPI001BDAD64A|nr:hypothetical protein [Novosphingobium profundi]MBT0666996.1 hypothetical protein [Novosphingobium profundi]